MSGPAVPVCPLVGIHHVQLACPPGGEDAARTFYRDLLGLREVAKPPDLAGRGGAWFRGPDPAAVEVHIGVEPDFRPARKAHPGLLVAGLDALARRLVHAGYPVSWDGALPGHRRCYVHDPHGNRLELLEPVSPAG